MKSFHDFVILQPSCFYHYCVFALKNEITALLCVSVSCQTAEEIDQLTVDEDLNDIERAVYLLR